MYEVEAFLSIVVAYAYVQGVLRGRTSLGRRARARDRLDGLRAQLGALPLCRPDRRDRGVRPGAAEALCARRRRCRGALPAVGADRPVAGAPHRCALVDRLPAFGISCSRPAPWSTATRCWSRWCSSAARACSSSAGAGTTTSARSWLRSRPWSRRRSSSPGSRRSSRPPGRRATSPSCSGRCCSSAPAASCGPSVVGSSPSPWSCFSGRATPCATTRRTRGRSRPACRGSCTRGARRLDPPGAGAGAPLLPRRRLSLGDDDGAGPGRPHLRLARCRRPPTGVEHAGPGRRDRGGGASRRRVRGRRTRVSRLPRLESDVDDSSSGSSRSPTHRHCRGTRAFVSSGMSTTNEIALRRNYFKLLQAFVYRRVG